jgi:hypothetical protein
MVGEMTGILGETSGLWRIWGALKNPEVKCGVDPSHWHMKARGSRSLTQEKSTPEGHEE